MKRVFISVLLVIAATGLFAQDLRIDFRFNVDKDDTANYLNWSLGKEVIKDKYDAASGASVAGSTYGFDVVRYDNEITKNAALPAALRNLLLFPVSPFGIAIGDNFTVEETKQGLVIRFVHRGVAYELKTDKKGNYNAVSDARAARGLADNVGGKFIIKEEFVKAGTDGSKGADLDWDKITLVPDTRAVSASRWFEGTLKVKYKKGILTMKGTLEEMKR
ncbi:MAG TPA: hypothetical protein PLP41_08900 [Treponemataceae bacterium]|nr:hypothetical protein [Treponemataceae bacterium]HOS36142.1 hypothetical protein [Treponemataceae bacterium]HPL92233.1 hypothetical protein [Treponemataceae bacterium]